MGVFAAWVRWIVTPVLVIASAAMAADAKPPVIPRDRLSADLARRGSPVGLQRSPSADGVAFLKAVNGEWP